MRGKENKGITLIALVITIIVLLILAGVAIATLTGENGLLTKTKVAKEKNDKAQAEEEVKLAATTLRIEASQRSLSDDEKVQILEKELTTSYPKQEPETTVNTEGTKFKVNHRGYEFEIDSEYQVSINEPFNAEEWDKDAAEEDCFYWESNTKGEDGYNTIIGYTSKIENYTKLRFPSRCTEIKFPDIGDYGDGVSSQISRTFTNNIKRVEIPRTVALIGDETFGTSSSISFQMLKEVIIPDSVTSIGRYAFSYCANLSNITIPDSVINIGEFAFSYCTNLTDVSMSKNVTTIGRDAFSYCTSLSNIIIWENVSKMGVRIFGEWEDTQTINIEANQVPSGWDPSWNNECNAKIVYGYTGE